MTLTTVGCISTSRAEALLGLGKRVYIDWLDLFSPHVLSEILGSTSFKSGGCSVVE